jgi:hypothetical protein
MTEKKLIIITGPPGGGKAEYAASLPYQVHDQQSGNKALWRDSADTCIMVTAAPGMMQKEYWCKEARRFGFKPQLLVLDPGRNQAISNLLKRRDPVVGSEKGRARLSKTAQRWYFNYSQHPDEQKVD